VPRRPRPGDILVVSLPILVPPGHEQEGMRPVVVMGLPERVGTPRYPMILGVPLTTQVGTWAKRSPVLYPRFEAGTAGLPHTSVALLDHVRGVDAKRVVRYVGSLSPEEFALIREGLTGMCGL
jgi:mRNA interferase MazF